MRTTFGVFSSIIATTLLYLVVCLVAVQLVFLRPTNYVSVLQTQNAYERILDNQTEVSLCNNPVASDVCTVNLKDVFTAEWLQRQVEPLILNVFDVANSPEATIDDLTAEISLTEPKSKLSESLNATMAQDSIGQQFGIEANEIVESFPNTIPLKTVLVAPEKITNGEFSDINVTSALEDDKVDVVSAQLDAVQESIHWLKIATWGMAITIVVLIIFVSLLFVSGRSKLKALGWTFLLPGLGLTISGAIVVFVNKPIASLVIANLPEQFSSSSVTLVSDITREIITTYSWYILIPGASYIIFSILFFSLSLLFNRKTI